MSQPGGFRLDPAPHVAVAATDNPSQLEASLPTFKHLSLGLFLGFTLLLGGCGDPSKQDILKKAEKAATKAQLEGALGKPTEVSKVGPVEKWTYKAKDGTVVFMITGDKVAVSGAN